MLVTVYFSDINSLPVTGLTPTISIYDLDSNTRTINAVAMTEVSNTIAQGWYKYDYTTIDLSHSYTVNVDGGAIITTPSLRYQVGVLSPMLPEVPAVDFGS